MATEEISSPRPLISNTSKHPNEHSGLILSGNHRPPADWGVEGLELDEAIVRHAAWRDVRAQTWTAMLKSGLSTMRLERFAQCGSGLWLMQRPADLAQRLSCNCCKDRWCQPCAASRGRRLADALLATMADLARVRFVTLTLKHRPASLRDCLDRLYRSFAALRRRPLWRDAVSGCAVICEIKVGRDGLWHPHLHVLATGSYVDQAALSREWLAITGDSSIVDVRLVKSAQSIAFYVTKYVSKGCDSTVYSDPARLQEAIVTMRGRRLCMTCGDWRGIKLLPPAEDAEIQEYDDEGRPLHDDDALRYRPVLRLDGLAQRARSDAALHAVWHELIARFGCLAVLYDPRVPD